jgi:hypothetical protein
VILSKRAKQDSQIPKTPSSPPSAINLTDKQQESLSYMLKMFENAEKVAGILEEPELLTIKDFDTVNNLLQIDTVSCKESNRSGVNHYTKYRQKLN